jgi:hypothetical protein
MRFLTVFAREEATRMQIYKWHDLFDRQAELVNEKGPRDDLSLKLR